MQPTSTKSDEQDIVIFLKNKKGGVVIKSLDYSKPLRSRVPAFLALLKRKFSLSEFLSFALPSFLSDRKKLQDKYDNFLCEESKKEYPCLADNCLNLFGQSFYGYNYHEIIELVNEVVVRDQYQAERFLEKNSIVIDAGAHIGTFSIFASKLASNGKVYSFEPVSKTFQILKKNTEHYKNITCTNLGLDNAASQKNIFVNPKRSSGSVFEDSPYISEGLIGGKDGAPELSRTTTLDEFVAEQNIKNVDFIKIDTEGYEAKILKGAEKTIEKYKPIISMAAYHGPEDKKELPEIIKKICPDYVCELHKDYEDDLICYAKRVPS